MLDRIQAYRKFVDEEKEAAIADLQRQFAEDRKAMGSGAERLKACEEFYLTRQRFYSSYLLTHHAQTGSS